MAVDPHPIEPTSEPPASAPEAGSQPVAGPLAAGPMTESPTPATVADASPTSAPSREPQTVTGPPPAEPTGEVPAPAREEASQVDAEPVSSRSTASDGRELASVDSGVAGAAIDQDVIVSMRGVSRQFDHRQVLTGIDLSVPRGTILGVIGPSGAGKTTTIRMLTGALAPTTGEVVVMGRPPQRFRRADRERIGYMPQSFALYEDLTAGENVDFVASLFGMLWRRRRRRVREVLQVVDLWAERGRQAGKLSGGMQRRLELACALVHEPELIILDEPTAGIDPLLRGTIWDELHRLRDAGRTLLVTTQHVAEADECDAVAMIVGGRIIALATPNELRRLATNGDLLEIETATTFDGAGLAALPGVRGITQQGPRNLRVVVDDAGSSLPNVVEAIKSADVEVESAREQRLSFDEIFAILVARSQENPTDGAAEQPAGDRPAGDGSDADGPLPPDRTEAAA